MIDTSSNAAFKRFQQRAPKQDVQSEPSARYMSVADSLDAELARLEDALPLPPMLPDQGWSVSENAALEKAMVKFKTDPDKWTKIAEAVGRPSEVRVHSVGVRDDY